MEALTADQQFIFATASKEPAKLIYALGKNPARLKALLEIKNPVKFIAEVARMETQMTTKSRRSEEHTSELQSLMRTSYAVFCLKKNIKSLPDTSVSSIITNI